MRTTSIERRSRIAQMGERMKRTRAAVVGATVVAVTAVGTVNPAAAKALTDEMPITGTFIARSMGEWAKTNESYHDETTITSTWTVRSTCTDPNTCTGDVSSDAGWAARLVRIAGAWVIHREIPDWQPCVDGTAGPGHQTIRFWGVDGNGLVLPRQSEAIQFTGEDRTVGDSGVCGVSRWVTIRMPFTMRKVASS